jgi:hypothetical protein
MSLLKKIKNLLKKSERSCYVFFSLILFLFSITSFCSENEEFQGRAAQYYVQSESESQLQIKVYIWGQVLRPGLYQVPDNTDLVALLSFAGGPTEEARLTMVRIVRGDPDNQEVLEINVKNFLKNGQVNEIPVLKPGDTVVVSGSMFHAFSKLVSFIAKIAVVISTYELLFN